MIRNLKALGLAMAAVFAFSAVAASGASAQQGVLTSDGPVTLTGAETVSPLFANAFTTASGAVTCDGSTGTGHRIMTEQQTEEGKTHELLASGETTGTATPHNNNANCRVHIPLLGTRTATITTNGCDSVVHLGETEPAENEEGIYGITSDLVCPPEKHVEIHVYKLNVEHTPGNHICTFTIKPQTGLGGPRLTSTAEAGELHVAGTVTGIKEEHSGSLCGEGSSEEAELHVDTTITGHNELGEPTGVTISH